MLSNFTTLSNMLGFGPDSEVLCTCVRIQPSFFLIYSAGFGANSAPLLAALGAICRTRNQEVVLCSEQQEKIIQSVEQKVAGLLEPRLQAVQTNILQQVQAMETSLLQQVASSTSLREAAFAAPSSKDRQGLVVVLLPWCSIAGLVTRALCLKSACHRHRKRPRNVQPAHPDVCCFHWPS